MAAKSLSVLSACQGKSFNLGMHRAEEELKQAWADAFDAHIDVPGEAGTIYSRPISLETPSSPDAHQPLAYPDSVTATTRLYCITAWNPMGIERPLDENNRAHCEFTTIMKERVDQLRFAEDDVWLRYSFGFSANWREPGLVIACKSADACMKIKHLVVEMARRYNQGAVYEYTPQSDARLLLRKTLPVMSSALVEADVMVCRCQKPDLDFAEPCQEILHPS
jgi:hypothetical protein